MAGTVVGQFEVVPQAEPTKGQAVGRLALFKADGTPWTGGDAGPATVAWVDVTDKPATYPPTIGTTATTAKAGNYTPPNASTGVRGLVLQAATQAASTATDVPGLVADFNTLLAKLKAAGIVA
jgi:hypothetical protein